VLSNQEEFNRNGYTLIKSLVEPHVARGLYAYGSKLEASGQLTPDRLVPGAPSVYGNLFMEGMLERLQPKIEQALGRRLHATYTYFRIYRTGDKLRRHKDRQACEISVSLCLGYVAETPWPLFIEGPNGVFAAAMQPGDGVLYKGLECPHWREPFTGESAGQLSLHYVDQDGPYAKLKFDGRAALAMPLAHA
jgi:hypothetical protein